MSTEYPTNRNVTAVFNQCYNPLSYQQKRVQVLDIDQLVDEAVTAYKEGETVEVTEVIEVPAAATEEAGEQPVTEGVEQPPPTAVRIIVE